MSQQESLQVVLGTCAIHDIAPHQYHSTCIDWKQGQVSPAKLPEQTAVPNLTLRLEFSPTVGALFGALAKARKVFKPIIKASENPFFKSKYADLAEVLSATVDGLSDNGLAIVQPPTFRRTDGTVEIHTIMGHSSGEWAHSILEMPVSKVDAQGVGSAITYGRRYAYSGMVSVASELDDDANAAVSKTFTKADEQEAVDRADYLKVFEIQGIDEAIKKTGKTEEEVKAYLDLIGIDRIEHIQRSGFKATLAWANAKSNPKPKGPTVVDQDRMKAMKRLFAFADDHSIPENDVKRASYERFGVDSMTKLTAAQLDEMHDWVKGVADAVNQS